MKYDITIKKNRRTETVSVSTIRELHEALTNYRAKGYEVKDISNAFGRTRGILSLSFN